MLDPDNWLRANYFWVMDDDHNLSCVATMEEWCSNPGHHRVIDQAGNSEIWVSTIFIGLNRNLTNGGPPILFETMVFGGELDELTLRYSTYEEAVEGHKALVQVAFAHVRSDQNEEPRTSSDAPV